MHGSDTTTYAYGTWTVAAYKARVPAFIPRFFKVRKYEIGNEKLV
jgi:hypothetical protein